MKTNNQMPKKTQNSFIYFQIGLISTMLVVLFVLEMNFKTPIAEMVQPKPDDLEEVFVYNPAPIKEVLVEKKVVEKVVQPKTKSTTFIPTKNEVVEQEPTEEPVENSTNIAAEAPATLPTDIVTKTPETTYTGFSVEVLPRFKACENVAKAQQKQCFEEQLRKEIMRKTNYPDEDLENRKEGVVLVEFIVDENGKFTQIKALNDYRRSTKAMQNEVEKAVKKLPQILPGEQGGKKVKVKYSIPISFKIN